MTFHPERKYCTSIATSLSAASTVKTCATRSALVLEGTQPRSIGKQVHWVWPWERPC